MVESPWDCVRCPAIVKLGDPYFEGPCGTFCSVCMKEHVKTCRVCAEKFPEAVTPRFGCPACKSENISENNIIQVQLRVAEWDVEGEPAAFRYPWREVDDTFQCVDENEARYHCNDCDNGFGRPEHIHGEVHGNGTAA
jgi:hypothetical protein